MTVDVPRRIDRSRHTPAERAITEAMEAVEKAGAHPRLTDAVVLLGRARDAVADFVDGAAPAPIPAPGLGRFVQVNIAPRCANPVWRPALVVAVWPTEFPSHPSCSTGLNVQVFLDGTNDEWTLRGYVGQSCARPTLPEAALSQVAAKCQKGHTWETSLPHEGILLATPDYRGMVWRWPPRD